MVLATIPDEKIGRKEVSAPNRAITAIMANWYQTASLRKFASVTFRPAGADKIAQPLSVLDISFDIIRFIYATLKIPGVQATFDNVTSDGDDHSHPTGILNFYETENSGLSTHNVLAIVEGYNRYKEGVVRLAIVDRNQSRLRNCPTTRVKVVENNSGNYAKVPELNISNNSAYQFLKYLQDQGIQVNPKELSGEISADAIKYILSDESPPDPAPYASEMDVNSAGLQMGLQEELGAKFIDASPPIDYRFNRYREVLKHIVDFIDHNQLPDRQIIFN